MALGVALDDGHAGRQTLTMDAEWSCCARASVTRGDLLLEVHRSVGAYELQGPHVLLFERAVCPVWLWSLCTLSSDASCSCVRDVHDSMHARLHG